MKKDAKLRTIKGARILRKEMTAAEKRLWLYLNNRGMCGIKFRRQHPISGFIVDFYCPKNRLAIEIDGEIHDNQKEHDTARQSILESQGIRFLRFRNQEVLNNIDMVLKTIKRKACPSPQSGEGCPDVHVGTG